MNRSILRIILTTLVIVLFLMVFGKKSEGMNISEGTMYDITENSV